MANAAVELPDDIETLKAMVLAARAETAALTAEAAQLRAANTEAAARIERLHALIKALERARDGRRSETLNPDQHEFAFEEIQTGLGAIEVRHSRADRQRLVQSPARRPVELPQRLNGLG